MPPCDRATRSRCGSISTPWATTSRSPEATSSSGTSRSTTAIGSGRCDNPRLGVQPRLVAEPVGQRHVVQRGAHPRAARRSRSTRRSGAAISAPSSCVRERATVAAPTIDGKLTEPVWNDPLVTPSTSAADDNALRAHLPGRRARTRGPVPAAGERRPGAVVDPGDATVKLFLKGNAALPGLRRARSGRAVHRRLRPLGRLHRLRSPSTRCAAPINSSSAGGSASRSAPTGTALAQDYLPTLVSTRQRAQVALTLKPGTTVDTLGVVAGHRLHGRARIST